MVIREMTGRLKSSKIEKRWNNLLGGVVWSGEEAAENDLYIKSLKHKHSTFYTALYEYWLTSLFSKSLKDIFG